jgi:trehalose/maltose hydrolase-like predicted phosphorylase
MMDFRFNTLPQAKKTAAKSLSGRNVSLGIWSERKRVYADSAKLDMNEHHVTADAADSRLNYYKVTKDKLRICKKRIRWYIQLPIFWVSRAVKDEKGYYHIRNIGARWISWRHFDDNAFTNGAVKVVLTQP